jgi:hypothetical protein
MAGGLRQRHLEEDEGDNEGEERVEDACARPHPQPRVERRASSVERSGLPVPIEVPAPHQAFRIWAEINTSMTGVERLVRARRVGGSRSGALEHDEECFEVSRPQARE